MLVEFGQAQIVQKGHFHRGQRQLVAVRLGADDILPADHAGRTGLVDDDDALGHHLGCGLGEGPGHYIGAATGLVRNDQLYRVLRIASLLGKCWRDGQRQHADAGKQLLTAGWRHDLCKGLIHECLRLCVLRLFFKRKAKWMRPHP